MLFSIYCRLSKIYYFYIFVFRHLCPISYGCLMMRGLAKCGRILHRSLCLISCPEDWHYQLVCQSTHTCIHVDSPLPTLAEGTQQPVTTLPCHVSQDIEWKLWRGSLNLDHRDIDQFQWHPSDVFCFSSARTHVCVHKHLHICMFMQCLHVETERERVRSQFAIGLKLCIYIYLFIYLNK